MCLCMGSLQLKKEGEKKCWDKKWWNLTRCHNAIACIFNKTFQSVCMSSITTILFLKWLYNGKIALWHWSMTSSGKCTFFESTLVANANDEKKNMLKIVKKKHTQKFIHELIKRKMTRLWHSKNNFLIQMFIKKNFVIKKEPPLAKILQLLINFRKKNVENISMPRSIVVKWTFTFFPHPQYIFFVGEYECVVQCNGISNGKFTM